MDHTTDDEKPFETSFYVQRLKSNQQKQYPDNSTQNEQILHPVIVDQVMHIENIALV